MKVPFIEAPIDAWSYYKNPLGKAVHDCEDYEMLDVYDILEKIGSGVWKERSEEIKQDHWLKPAIDIFYPTGITRIHMIGKSQKYTGMVWFDVDDLDDPAKEKEKLKHIPWILSAFITTSGKGLKILVPTNCSNRILTPQDAGEYVKIEAAVYEELHSLTGLVRDKRCSTVHISVSVSYDPDIYINYKPLTFVNNI